MVWGCFGSFHHFQGIFFHFLQFENPEKKWSHTTLEYKGAGLKIAEASAKSSWLTLTPNAGYRKKTLSLRFRKVTFCKPYATLCCPRNPWEPSPVPARHKGGGKRRHCPQTVETALKWWVHVCNKSLAIKSLAITYTPKMNLKLEFQSEKFCNFFLHCDNCKSIHVDDMVKTCEDYPSDSWPWYPRQTPALWLRCALHRKLKTTTKPTWSFTQFQSLWTSRWPTSSDGGVTVVRNLPRGAGCGTTWAWRISTVSCATANGWCVDIWNGGVWQFPFLTFPLISSEKRECL